MSYWDLREGGKFLIDPVAHENIKMREKMSETDLKALAYENKSKEPISETSLLDGEWPAEPRPKLSEHCLAILEEVWSKLVTSTSEDIVPLVQIKDLIKEIASPGHPTGHLSFHAQKILEFANEPGFNESVPVGTAGEPLEYMRKDDFILWLGAIDSPF